MMRRYVDYLQTKTKDHILYFGLGDWYDIGPKPPGESQLTPAGITSTAIYYYDLGILSRISRLLKKEKEANRFAITATDVRTAFNRAFFNEQTKQYGTGSQTANAMAVYMGLVTQKNKAAVIDNLVNDIRAHKNSLTAGDIGYHYLLSVLDEAGRSDIIYDMNNRSDVPGYGYQLAHGATALTESWQAYPSVSNNHFMLGHLMEWFYSGLCGIRMSPHAVAFHHFDIRPTPVGDLQFAKAHYLSPYGLIGCEWTKSKGALEVKVEIPPNTRATIYLPGSIFQLGSGTYSFRVAS
jgi:alpha-L-rhamnosidase